jgi:DNA-binding SARP family transcriptional activator
VELRLLGPVEAWAGREQIELGPRKQRFALAVLALHVNQSITVDRLVDLTWPERPPRTARHAVQVCVSRLRGTLSEAAGDTVRIVTRGATYALRADPMCIDAFRFRAFVDDARNESADTIRVAMLRRALALWYGPPLADVAYPADQLCRGLQEVRLVALEECLEAELRLGRHSVVIDHLVELTAQHPHRQRLVAQLMVALYRDGRAPEALRAYHLVRDQLVDEFGLDPHVDLQQLEGAILRADPLLDLPRPAPHLARPDLLPTRGGHPRPGLLLPHVA